jgi:hypothetical protein
MAGVQRSVLDAAEVVVDEVDRALMSVVLDFFERRA